MLLTQSTTPIIGQIAVLLGYVMQFIFQALSSVGIQNIGLCIIIFTIIVRILLLPMTYKQQKFSKMSQVMQPEIQAIQKKYRGKKDQVSMQKQNEEIQAVYDKYGVSMSGGCLQIAIQMPIFFALYQVIRRIPAYIPQVKAEFIAIVDAIDITNSATIDTIKKVGEGISNAYSGIDKLTVDSGPNAVIDVLNYFDKVRWDSLAKSIPSAADVIHTHSSAIIKMNDFIAGINVTQVPGWKISIYMIIPVVAALFQYFAAKTIPQPQGGNDAAGMTRSMTLMMPFMSFFICVTTPAGLGIYWATSAGFQLIQQLVINRMMKNADIDKMIEENLAKAEKKRASGKKSVMQRIMSKTSQASQEGESDRPIERDNSISSQKKLRNIPAPKIDGAKDRGYENDDYYSVIEKLDHRRLGEISKNAYIVTEYDKQNAKPGRGGNK